MAAKFHVYQDKGSEYRWRLVHDNGQTIATGGEGYSSKESCKSGVAAVQRDAATAEVVED